ncbi:hypothetical protein [Phyllobacterium sp. K27]
MNRFNTAAAAIAGASGEGSATGIGGTAGGASAAIVDVFGSGAGFRNQTSLAPVKHWGWSIKMKLYDAGPLFEVWRMNTMVTP